jgi:hypothetical protein
MSATGLDGTTYTDGQLLDRIQADGAFLVVRGPAERLRAHDWGGELRAGAAERGMRLAIRDLGEVMLLCDLHRTHPSLGEPDEEFARRPDSASVFGPMGARGEHPSRAPHLTLIRGGLLDGPGDEPDDAADKPTRSRQQEGP